MYRKSMTRNPRLYIPSKGNHSQDFYALKKIHRPRPGSNPRISDPEASMITTGPPGTTVLELTHLSYHRTNFCISVCVIEVCHLGLERVCPRTLLALM